MNVSRRKLYVHVGPMKTGTTAVQSVLREHDNSVVIYPRGFLYAGAHHPLVFNFFGDSRAKRTGLVDFHEPLEEIRTLTTGNDRNLLISSEALVPMAWQPHRIEPGALIRALLPYAGVEESDVEILATCREHFSWAASTYNQRLKGSETSGPDEFLRRFAGALCFAPILRSLERSGFRVTAMNYHPSESWVERFLTYVGFPPQAIPQTENLNTSLTPSGLILKLAANRSLPGGKTSRKLRRKLLSTPEFAAPSQFIFGGDAVRAAEEIFSEDRRILAGEYAIDLPQPDLDAPNMFFVSPQDLETIENFARSLGVDERAIVGAAREFVRN